MKRKALLLIMICLILLLASCSLWNMIMGTQITPATMGTYLSVDADGHFTIDIFYDQGEITFSFSSAGAYESLYYDYSSAEEDFILIGGYRGTYTWDPDTMLIEKSYSQIYDDSTESWENSTTVYSYTCYFTTQTHGSAYPQQEGSDDVWLWSSSTEDDEGYTEIRSREWLIQTESMTWFAETHATNSDGDTTFRQQDEEVYEILAMYPENSDWAAGESVNFNTKRTTDRYRTWDINSDGWGDWTGNDDALVMLPLSHAGTFLFSTTIDSTRTSDFNGTPFEEVYDDE